ncbi:hypothetical protein QBC41DRAFT_275387 [Cercophora samala]|uniref:Uncharacterized protein n=1 Tax=Cercophora samala TaxID=330535 RepID=A0AA39ZDM6_9PEZI|nr:hypothetical protein QBC41DRAFT_275387 [Cercophora samala]
MYLNPHTRQASPPSAFRRSATPSDSPPLNSAQTAALIVFGVLLGLLTIGVILWCCCCRGPGWRRRSSSRSKVKIIRMSGPRERSEKGSPVSTGIQGASSPPPLPVFLPLPAPLAPLAPLAPMPIRPLGPRGMLSGALNGHNAGPGEVTRDCSPERQNNPLHIHQYQHHRPQTSTHPTVPPAQYTLPPLLQSFAQPQTPVVPQVPQIPKLPQQPPQQPPQPLSQPPPPQPQSVRIPPPQLRPLRIPPPLIHHVHHHYSQPRPPIAKIINDHAAGVTRPAPLALPIGRHGMVNLALKYQVHSEKGASRPVSSRGLESGYQSAYCESSAESDGGEEMGYESMENFGRVEEDRRGRWARLGV